MTPSLSHSSPDSIEAREFEQLIRDAIIAIKDGNRSLGKRLLDQAALINRGDSRVWIWLSATTDNLEERRTYLETAVAIDPSDATAKRGLLLVTEKLDQSRLVPEGEGYVPQANRMPEEAVVKTYTCPNCGAAISYDIHETHLVCKFCGFTRKIDQALANESTDQLLDEALPTTRAHRWADTQSRLTCEQCGVVILLPPGQTADSCPNCASNRFITSPSLLEIIDPQVIGPFKIDAAKAAGSVKTWLGKGLLSPDDLALRHAGMQLHPAYYPFWLFSGTVEIPWFCDVNVGSGGREQWEALTGSQFENFDNVLIPGLRSMPLDELTSIQPFNLAELVEFSPDYLAGWVALTYDHPLSDASLRAREQVVKKAQLGMAKTIESSRPKRNFSIGAGKWSGLTYKLALLPIYIGNYPFQGKRFRLLVNGQTSKVGGTKPRDSLKTLMVIAAGILLLVILVVIFGLLTQFLPG